MHIIFLYFWLAICFLIYAIGGDVLWAMWSDFGNKQPRTKFQHVVKIILTWPSMLVSYLKNKFWE